MPAMRTSQPTVGTKACRRVCRFVFFSSRRRHTRFDCDWSSDVCSSDLTVIDQLSPLLAAGDVIIDGGNSFYGDDIARAHRLAEAKIDYIDCGTSGGVFGLERSGEGRGGEEGRVRGGAVCLKKKKNHIGA